MCNHRHDERGIDHSCWKCSDPHRIEIEEIPPYVTPEPQVFDHFDLSGLVARACTADHTPIIWSVDLGYYVIDHIDRSRNCTD